MLLSCLTASCVSAFHDDLHGSRHRLALLTLLSFLILKWFIIRALTAYGLLVFCISPISFEICIASHRIRLRRFGQLSPTFLIGPNQPRSMIVYSCLDLFGFVFFWSVPWLSFTNSSSTLQSSVRSHTTSHSRSRFLVGLPQFRHRSHLVQIQRFTSRGLCEMGQFAKKCTYAVDLCTWSRFGWTWRKRND